MKNLIKFTFYIFSVSLSGILYAQQFSDDIIIQGPQPNEWFKSGPVIDIDSQENIGIVWANNYNDHYTINFVRSTDGGITFDSIRTVDDIPYSTTWGGWWTPSIVYDAYDNPLVFYFSSLQTWTTQFRLKKSNDNGVSFPIEYQYYNSEVGFNFDFILSDVGIGYMAYRNGLSIMIRITFDYGNTFPDSTIIDTDNFAVSSNIKLVQCGNGDILCFWDGQDQVSFRNTIFYNRSVDGGNTFLGNVELDSITPTVGGIYAITKDNYVFITYAGKPDSINRKLIFRKSNDNGVTFSNIKNIHSFNTSLSSGPSPCIRYLSSIGLCIAWHQINDDSKISFTRSKDLGETFDSTITIVTEQRWRESESLAISDSGDVFIVSKFNNNNNNYIIINKEKIPLISGLFNSSKTKPNSFYLKQNYPNPFNSSTQFIYYLNKKTFVSMKIFNLLGEEINSLVNKEQIKGLYKINWDANMLPSGIYFVQLIGRSSNEKTRSETNKILLIK